MVSVKQECECGLAGSSGSGALTSLVLRYCLGAVVISRLNWGEATSKLTRVIVIFGSRIKGLMSSQADGSHVSFSIGLLIT